MTLRTTLLPLLAISLTACSPFAATPATRTVPLETVAPVRVEHTGIAVSGGVHGTWETAGSASVRVRHGLLDDLELQLEGNWAYAPGLERDRPLSGHVGTARIGVKHRVLEWLAFTAGFGSGAGPWGMFGGGDLGTIFAYENPYVVPFVALRMQLTGPFDPRSEARMMDNGMGGTTTVFLTPGATLWFQTSTGVRVPICADCEGPRGSFVIGAAWSQLYAIEADRPLGAIGGEMGFEIEL